MMSTSLISVKHVSAKDVEEEGAKVGEAHLFVARAVVSLIAVVARIEIIEDALIQTQKIIEEKRKPPRKVNLQLLSEARLYFLA